MNEEQLQHTPQDDDNYQCFGMLGHELKNHVQKTKKGFRLNPKIIDYETKAKKLIWDNIWNTK